MSENTGKGRANAGTTLCRWSSVMALVVLQLTRSHVQQSDLGFHELSSTNRRELGLELKMVVRFDLKWRSACF